MRSCSIRFASSSAASSSSRIRCASSSARRFSSASAARRSSSRRSSSASAANRSALSPARRSSSARNLASLADSASAAFLTRSSASISSLIFRAFSRASIASLFSSICLSTSANLIAIADFAVVKSTAAILDSSPLKGTFRESPTLLSRRLITDQIPKPNEPPKRPISNQESSSMFARE